MIFDKSAKTIQLGKGQLFQLIVGKPDIHMQKNEAGLFLILYTNTTYSNWIKNLNVETKISFITDFGNDILNMTAK